jgi:hypothetical protein
MGMELSQLFENGVMVIGREKMFDAGGVDGSSVENM